jgi:hypothetical protein
MARRESQSANGMQTTAALQPLGEYVGLKAASARFGIPASTLRAYVADGRVPAYRTPSGRLWFRPVDINALFQPVTPKGK